MGAALTGVRGASTEALWWRALWQWPIAAIDEAYQGCAFYFLCQE